MNQGLLRLIANACASNLFIGVFRGCVGAVFMNETAEPVPVQLDEILVPLG